MANETTVYVACKMPGGLILRNYRQTTTQELVLGGGVRDVSLAVMVGEPVRIKGYQKPPRKKNSPQIAVEAEYEVTKNVPKDFMEAWFKANADSALVKNKIIMFHASADSLQSMIRENEKRRTGFEPLDPDDLPKVAGPVKTFSGETSAAA